MATNLAEHLQEYAADHAAPGSAADVAIRRAYMAGALQVLLLRSKGASESALLDECRQFGRAVGTAAERAS